MMNVTTHMAIVVVTQASSHVYMCKQRKTHSYFVHTVAEPFWQSSHSSFYLCDGVAIAVGS